MCSHFRCPSLVGEVCFISETSAHWVLFDKVASEVCNVFKIETSGVYGVGVFSIRK